VKFLLNILEVTFDDSNVPRKACVTHGVLAWLRWLWNRDIAKCRIGLDIKHICHNPRRGRSPASRSADENGGAASER
jgi:hypothetical protein